MDRENATNFGSEPFYTDEDSFFEFVRSNKFIDYLTNIESQSKLLDALRGFSDEQKYYFFINIYRAPQELRLQILSYWCYGEKGLMEIAKSIPDSKYSEHLDVRKVDLDDYAPYDGMVTDIPTQATRIPLSHQTGMDNIIGIAYFDGIRASSASFEPTGKETFTHPLISRWIDSTGQPIQDMREIPRALDENGPAYLNHLALHYTKVFKAMRDEIDKLTMEFPSIYLKIDSGDAQELNFRYALKREPQIKIRPETERAYARAKDAATRVLDVLVDYDAQFQTDSKFHQILEAETGNSELGVSPAQKLQVLLERFLGASRVWPTFYRPNFSLLIEQETASLDPAKLQEGQFVGTEFYTDEYGSFIYKGKKNNEPEIPADKIKCIVLYTDFLESEEAEKMLEELKLTLRVAYIKQPQNALPVYDSKGRMLWPKLESMEQKR